MQIPVNNPGTHWIGQRNLLHFACVLGNEAIVSVLAESGHFEDLQLNEAVRR